MLKKALVLFFGSFFLLAATKAQDRYFTKTGRVEFSSKAPLEDIEAQNKTVTAVLDAKTGALQFSVQMKSFEFEKALMQQHFNENYVESDKYPKAEFKGLVANNAAVNYGKQGTYPVTVKGKLTLRNITKDVEVPGTIKVADGKVEAISTFSIQLSDYKIGIPSPVKNKISNNIKIIVDTKLEPLKG
ncbi:MAG: YceI family protein [Bacteroidota bacterium]|nr:YceI family protein [Bacteroidota bacterium]